MQRERLVRGGPLKARRTTTAGKRQWTWAPNRRLKPKVPEEVKAELWQKADELVEQHLKPHHVKPPPKKPRWNYLTGIHTKWLRSFFYFVADYASPGPNAISPTFESPFARLEYTRDGKFSLAYLRHTGQWWQLHQGLTLEKALETVRDDGIFHPA